MGELCTFSKGHGYSKADIRDAGTPLILYGRLYTQYESRIEEVDTFAVGQDGSILSRGNEVIVPASGETAEDIAVASSVRRSGIILGGDLNVVTPTSKLDPDYTALAITYSKAHDDLAKRAQGKSVVHVHGNDIAEVEVSYPSESEQKRISSVVLNLDSLITLHQRECGKPPFNQSPAWEQRKFSDLVLIERGGSPRPIDAYITEDPAGLNWVKIGDAPSMGRYITTTSEKIKPEGLSKTRQVYPGDLVLSNSMSFGRPYIMAVEGCIHDGWLLIRDTQNQFDPVFLCHMLGTPQMLDQYRMFASGSTVNNLNKELVGNAMVPLPDRDEQVKIGNYLDELDGLITLHQRMCPIFSFCAHGSRTNFAQTLQGWLQILRYPRPIPKMLVSPSAPASGVFGTAKGAFICASSSAGASTSSPSARKNFITSSTLCCRESLSSP